jgi:hypothetical protein
MQLEPSPSRIQAANRYFQEFAPRDLEPGVRFEIESILLGLADSPIAMHLSELRTLFDSHSYTEAIQKIAQLLAVNREKHGPSTASYRPSLCRELGLPALQVALLTPLYLLGIRGGKLEYRLADGHNSFGRYFLRIQSNKLAVKRFSSAIHLVPE